MHKTDTKYVSFLLHGNVHEARSTIKRNKVEPRRKWMQQIVEARERKRKDDRGDENNWQKI